MTRRGDLEDALERDQVPWGAPGTGGVGRNGTGGSGLDGSPWLGQIVGGEWQVRSRAANRAVRHILGRLQDRGLLSIVPPSLSGKAHELVAINNHYATGEPFAVQRREEEKAERRSRKSRERAAHEPAEGEEGDGLAEIEKERLRNMARNQELLRQLGLA